MKKNLQTKLIYGLAISQIVLLLSGCSTQTPSTDTINTSVDTDGDGLSDSVEKTLGTNIYTADTDGDGINDKEDSQPLMSEVKIVESSGILLPITVNDVRVEDNTEDDHLEMTLTNTSSEPLLNFDIYYTVTDKVSAAEESYYQVLTNLSIPANGSVNLHFDNNTSLANHYFQNMNGLYGTSVNGLTFKVQLHAQGYAPLNINVEKSDGAAEVSD